MMQQSHEGQRSMHVCSNNSCYDNGLVLLFIVLVVVVVIVVVCGEVY